MGLLDRIREKRQQSVLPEEVKEYYKSEQRQKRGVAIGLALLALVVTIAIAAALFFGGRFVYNAIWGGDKPSGNNQSQNQPANNTNQPNNNQNQNQNGNRSGGNNPAPAPSNPAPQPSTPAPAPSPQPAPSTPSLGDDDRLPRTGDEGM